MMEQETDRPINGRGVERAEPEGNALSLIG